MAEVEKVEPGTSKRLALLISVLALCLAVASAGSKSAQTEVLSRNVEAANLWSFFQARTIRQTVLRTALEEQALGSADAAALAKQKEAWQATINRWESDPASGEGRKELTARATDAERQRDDATARYHLYEYSSALFEIAIVLASASVVTSFPALAWLGAVFGVCGLLFGGLGFFEPHLIHLP